MTEKVKTHSQKQLELRKERCLQLGICFMCQKSLKMEELVNAEHGQLGSVPVHKGCLQK